MKNAWLVHVWRADSETHMCINDVAHSLQHRISRFHIPSPYRLLFPCALLIRITSLFAGVSYRRFVFC